MPLISIEEYIGQTLPTQFAESHSIKIERWSLAEIPSRQNSIARQMVEGLLSLDPSLNRLFECSKILWRPRYLNILKILISIPRYF